MEKLISYNGHDDYLKKVDVINELSIKYNPSFIVQANKFNESYIKVSISRLGIGTLDSMNEYIRDLKDYFG